MSATDRIRADARQARERRELLLMAPDTAEALCDLAGFARVLHPHVACPPECSACDALARLDGEDGP